MKVAVVILNWNGKQLLEQFLPSVVQFSKEATVYVADNASTDDSVAFINAHFPEVSIVVNSTNTGYAGGYNEALQHIDADIYALVNSDIEVTENWLGLNTPSTTWALKPSKQNSTKGLAIPWKKKNHIPSLNVKTIMVGNNAIKAYGIIQCLWRMEECWMMSNLH